MGTLTQRTTHRVTGQWTDAVTSIPGAANAIGLLRNQSGQLVEIIKNGPLPAASDSGIAIPPYGQDYCEAATIWVRTQGPQAALVAFEILS